MLIQEAYTEWSATYDEDRNLTRDLDAVVTRRLLGDLYADVGPETIVELGCGTGKNTIFLAQIGRRVRAFDFAEGMIERAKAKVKATHVDFVRQDLTQPWACGDHVADLVVCNLVLEHVDDLTHIFGEAARVLQDEGHFLISELHPFRQYIGKKAEFRSGEKTVEIPAYVHHIGEFLDAAKANHFHLLDLQEWWHEEDRGSLEDGGRMADKPPRLVTFLWQKQGIERVQL